MTSRLRTRLIIRLDRTIITTRERIEEEISSRIEPFRASSLVDLHASNILRSTRVRALHLLLERSCARRVETIENFVRLE